MGSQGQSGPKVNAHGNRFVSVRAVFPLGDQLDELVKAMHEQRQKAADFVTFLDFEVERQVAQPGDKPWSGPWEKVDLQATLDLLDRIEFDTDVVDPVFTDSVFTMPLPQRVIGKWKTKLKDWASHPLIKTMTDEQAELQARSIRGWWKSLPRRSQKTNSPRRGSPRECMTLAACAASSRGRRPEW